MSTPQPPPTQRKSRVLAALDNPAFFSANPTASPAAAAALPPGSLGIAQTPVKQRYETPAPAVDYSTLLELAGGGSTQRKRKISGPENGYASGSSSTPPPRSTPAPTFASSRGGFGLNYDQESAVLSIDRGGHDQEMKMAEFVSQGIDNAAHGLTIKKAMKKLGLDDAKDLIPGMEVRLLPHQIIGVSWMVDQERNSTNKGGILADDMGLGKTVQMIASMVINQPSDDDKHRSNLIVVPAALLLQWKEELETKSNGIFEVHIQHGKDKIKNAEKLGRKDVVITTYQTLNQDINIPNGLDGADEVEWLSDNGGPMSQVKWYRVILDEAQFVRNRGTRCSKAVAMLRAKYRWCLTGTPITNTLADIYGYLRFGRFRPFNDWDDFNLYIARMQLEDAPLAGLRAQEVLKPILLRRTKDAKLENGAPILELPHKDVELVYVDFSKEERDLYEQFEKRAQIQINRFIRNNTLLKNHQQVFVLILRLRQVCAHPYLVLEGNEDFDQATAMMGASNEEKELLRAKKAMGDKWVNNLKQRFLNRARDLELGVLDDADEQEPVCPRCEDLFLEGSGRILACGHELCADCLDSLMTEPIAHDGIFGTGDDQTNFRIEKEYETAHAKGLRPCPTCKKMQDLRPNVVFVASAFMPTKDEVRAACRAATSRARSPPPKKRKIEIIEIDSSDSSSGSDSEDGMTGLMAMLKSSPQGSTGKAESTAKSKRPVKGKAKAKGKKGDSDTDMDSSSSSESDSDFATKKAGPKGKGKGKRTIVKVKDDTDRDVSMPPPPDMKQFGMWKEGGSNVEASAKMLQMVAYLKEWEATGDKTIVFSQWTSMLDLCEQIFARNGIRNLRYDGQMSREAREYALTQFRRPEGPRVILVSIKTGGVGLNLVSANRVINMDLAWNYATESQAYDRVHRLGQEKAVFVKRLVVRDTIEERMLRLQETKLGLAEAALGEGTGTKLQKLSVKQIKDLFGMNRVANRDEDRNTRVL